MMNEDLTRCLEYVVQSSEELARIIEYDLKADEINREDLKSNIEYAIALLKIARDEVGAG